MERARQKVASQQALWIERIEEHHHHCSYHHRRHDAPTESSTMIEPVVEDFDRLLRSCHGLIQVNQEIWTRCMMRRLREDDDDHAATSTFWRYDIATVCMDGSSSLGKEVTLSVQPRLEFKDFGKPPSFPSYLEKFVYLSVDSTLVEELERFHHKFPCYLALLEDQIGVLREEVALRCMPLLKEHLESLQDFLGGIESWLIYPALEHEAFLQELTGVSSCYGMPKDPPCKVRSRITSACGSQVWSWTYEDPRQQVLYRGKLNSHHGSLHMNFHLDCDQDRAMIRNMKGLIGLLPIDHFGRACVDDESGYDTSENPDDDTIHNE